MLHPSQIAGYQDSRAPGVNQQVLCHAPFVSLNFERSGKVTSCCYNRSVVLGSYPQHSLAEMWNGTVARDFRTAFLKDAEVPGCALCFHQLQSANYAGVLMRNFDDFATTADYAPTADARYPRVLEFEIANTCNLECVMCDGRWSSSIRARREQLPPLRSPYDQAFVDQLDLFLPHLMQAKFLGGEPFLIRRYYDIWERLAAVNPGARVTITTNASFLPERARTALEGMRAHIVVSLDAVTSPLYESIRRNARLDIVLAHVEYLLDYTRRAGTGMSLAVCPMTHNWQELHRVVRFAQDRGLHLHFNTVTRPYESSLVSLSTEGLHEVSSYLGGVEVAGDDARSMSIRDEITGLRRQVDAWRDTKQEFDARASRLTDLLRDRLTAPQAQRLSSGISSLVRCFLVAFELRQVAHGDLRHLLPQPPLVPWPGNTPPASLDLVCAVLVMRDVVGAMWGSGDRSPAGRTPPFALLERLELLDASDPHFSEHLDAAATSLRHHLGAADMDGIEESLRALQSIIAHLAFADSTNEGLVDAEWYYETAPLPPVGLAPQRIDRARAYARWSIASRHAKSAPHSLRFTPGHLPPPDVDGLRVRLDAIFLQLAITYHARGQSFAYTLIQLERVVQRLCAESDLGSLCAEIDETGITRAAPYLEESLLADAR